MNKQELIEKIEAIPAEDYKYRPYIDKKVVLALVRQLDEPQPVKVPPFVSVWYRVNKDNLYKNIAYLCANWEKTTTTDNVLFNWMSNTDNFIEILVNMHKFGYEVEKEPKYTVKIKATKHYFAKDGNGRIYFSLKYESAFTKIELEKVNLGWVFDCPGIEIEEVTE